MSGGASHNRPPFWRILLLPFSLVFWLIVALRNLLYDAGIRESTKLSKPTIAIGNLTAGGTGKTPVTCEVSRHLQGKGCKVAILSRGYGSSAEAEGLIFRAAHDDQPSINECGDEISMLALKLPGVWFGVGADRISSGRRVAAMAENDCFVLDDAFQHRKVERDLNIALIDATNPFSNRLMIPAGDLREPLAGLKRADVVVISRCDMVSEERLIWIEHTVSKQVRSAPIIRASTIVSRVRRLARDENSGSQLAKGKRVWALAGIGNPAGFADTIAKCGYELAGASWFPDHHRYSAAGVGKIVQDAVAAGAEAVVTTEKDAVKLAPSQFAALPCYVIEIGFDFGAQADIFWGIIDEVVQC